MTKFSLHPTLENDTIFMKNLELCQLRLMNNAHISWLILIPRENDITHFTQLDRALQNKLMDEVNNVAKLMENLFQPDRVNIAMLGNMVPQMHWHIIARHAGDICWPGPVWGNIPDLKYNAEQVSALKNSICNVLEDLYCC
ncbi:MAG: HIT family protein [Pseudomonadota bacterium]